MKTPFFRTAYNYDTDAVSLETAFKDDSPSLCVQSEAAATDINNIVKAFGLGQELPVGLRAPTYGDFTGINNFHDAANSIAYANQAFMELPAHVRARFNNDAGAFVDFTSDDNNRSEAEKLGLVFPKADDVQPKANDAAPLTAESVVTP